MVSLNFLRQTKQLGTNRIDIVLVINFYGFGFGWCVCKSPPDKKVDSGAAERIDELISDLSDLFLDL